MVFFFDFLHKSWIHFQNRPYAFSYRDVFSVRLDANREYRYNHIVCYLQKRKRIYNLNLKFLQSMILWTSFRKFVLLGSTGFFSLKGKKFFASKNKLLFNRKILRISFNVFDLYLKFYAEKKNKNIFIIKAVLIYQTWMKK